MSTPIPKEEFAHLFGAFANSAFRLELLDNYSVPSEEADYGRFLAGEKSPTSTGTEWAKLVKTRVAEGKIMQRVHVVSIPLSSYLQFEINWGYVYTSAAGEQIYLIDRNKVSRDVQTMTDFWLFDRKTLVTMQYDSAGHFLGAAKEESPVAIAAYRDTSDSLLSIATPLKAFLTQIHPV